MIKLLPVTALHYNLPTNPDDHYNLPTNPNELDIYIEINDKTAKELSSPGCDELTFDDVTGLSSRILHQLVRNHFNDPRQGAEYQWFAIDQTLHKQFTHFMDTLIPEASLIDFQHHDWHQTYIYQDQKDGKLSFKQYYYDVDNTPTVILDISI